MSSSPVALTAVQLTIVANARIPGEKAHVIQIVQMAAAFTRLFGKVRVVYPRRANTDAMRAVSDPFDYYDVPRDFGLVGLPCVDAVKRVTIDWPSLNRFPIPLIAHLLQLWTFALSAFFFVARLPGGVIYSRDLFVLTVLGLLSRHRDRIFVFEVHTLPRSGAARRLHLWAARRADAIVAISDHLRDWYRDRGFDPARLLVARDGVNLATFAALPDRNAARSRLGIPADARVVAYTGHFYRWKGADTLAATAPLLPASWEVHLVGGIGDDLRRLEALADGERLHVRGHLPQRDAALYVAAADVVVLPNSGHSDISVAYTSPLKLFEYLASGRPLVASDLPSIREVIEPDEHALLVPADDPAAFAAAIVRLGDDPDLAHRLAASARDHATAFAWPVRARLIAQFLEALP